MPIRSQLYEASKAPCSVPPTRRWHSVHAQVGGARARPERLAARRADGGEDARTAARAEGGARDDAGGARGLLPRGLRALGSIEVVERSPLGLEIDVSTSGSKQDIL